MGSGRLRAPLSPPPGPPAVRRIGQHVPPVRTRSIQPGDLVLVNKRGRVFHATVRGVAAGGGFEVAPIERGITWRHVKASEITEHWARTGVRREGRPPAGQLGFDELGA